MPIWGQNFELEVSSFVGLLVLCAGFRCDTMDLVRVISDSQLFLEARTHSSYANEYSGTHNERLEWYGGR